MKIKQIIRTTMIIDPNNSKHLIADEGKLLRQISSNIVFGNEVFLGTVMIEGQLVEDTVENFEEIDEINEEEN